jgi:hypothetical protein
VGVRQRDEARLEGAAGFLDGLGAAQRLDGDRLHGREGVLHAVIELVDEKLQVVLCVPPGGDVEDRPDDAAYGARLVPHREGAVPHPHP